MEQSDNRLSDSAVAGLANAIQIEVLTTLEKLVPTMRKPAALAASRLAGELAAYVATLSRSRQFALQAQSDFVIKQLQQSIALYSELGNRQVKDEGTFEGETSDLPTHKPGRWAGQVSGPTQLEREYGIARSTLHRWQRLNQVIAFRTGGRKYVFPVAQFIDGRPVGGITEVLGAFGDSRAAWQWLVSPCPSLDDHVPLRLLRIEQVDQVIDEARM